MDIRELEAEKTFRQILNHLPHNTNRVYCQIELKESDCILYMPIRENLVDKQKQAKAFYQELANAAKF